MIEKVADKVIIVLLLGALVWVSFSKPVVVQNEDLVKGINTAFQQVDKRLKALEQTPVGPEVAKK